jgi:hypothetical protein
MQLHGAGKLFSVFLALIAVGCETDPTPIQGLTTEPVIYALFSATDSLNYIRLQRTYSGNANATIGAGSKDSIYFSDVKVKLDFYTPDDFFLISEVFKPLLVHNKEPGFFTNEPYEVFYSDLIFKNYLLPDGYVILSVVSPEENILATCKFNYFKPPEIVAPRPGLLTYISLFGTQPFGISWLDWPSFTDYDVTFFFVYDNHYDKSIVRDTVAIKYHCVSNNRDPDARFPRYTLWISGETVFPKLKNSIPTDDEVQYRRFQSLYFELGTANPEFYEFLDFEGMAPYGSIGTYTNVTGGCGICTFVYSCKSSNYIFDNQTMDSLVNGRFTRSLHFIKW